MTTIYVASDVVQSISNIQFFRDADYVFGVIWRIFKRIGRILSFILAMCVGASVPLGVLWLLLWIYAAPH